MAVGGCRGLESYHKLLIMVMRSCAKLIHARKCYLFYLIALA